MKRLLNAALIAALGFCAGACTVVTDPSSGSSASSGGSETSGLLDRQQQIAAVPPADRDVVANAADREPCGTEVGELDRMVDQLVVIDGRVTTESGRVDVDRRECGRHPPGTRKRRPWSGNREFAACRLEALGAEEQHAAIEEAPRRVEIGCAYRQVEGVDRRDHRQRTGTG